MQLLMHKCHKLARQFDQIIFSRLLTEGRDKSGKEHHVQPPAGATAPRYDPKGWSGRPAIAFDGHILHHREKRFAYDTHTIVVARAGRTAGEHDLVGSGGSGDGHILLTNRQGRFRGQHWSAGVPWLDSKTPSLTTPVIYVQHMDRNALILRRNGAIDGSIPLKPVINSAMRPFVLGNRTAAARGSFVGDIAEVLVFSGPVSNAELLELEGLLAHKWGLAGSLPADHPYHTSAPKQLTLAATTAYGSPTSPGRGNFAVDHEFLRTDMSAVERGGVLGLGAILVRNSRTRRTSPVNRGLWVVETVLGRHLPPPPANVPQIPDAVEADRGKTLRQQMVLHRNNAACAACHARIDPFGFAFEAFDAAGRLRSAEVRKTIEYESTRDGVLLDGVESLRSYLRAHSHEVERTLVRRMLGYALNRPVAVSDFPLIDRTLEQLPKSDHRLSSIVEQIVLSRQLRARRAADEREFSQPK
ncbi:MAG: DUF1588 domain-containing protein [Planctomycetia bacterium]|nr:DUF1588 domain-containing protein [Planctomycetia bacterium]